MCTGPTILNQIFPHHRQLAATPSVDFSASPSTLSASSAVNGPDQDLCFTVPVINDESVEVEECLGVSINLMPDADGLMVSIAPDAAFALVCIQDDDRKELIKVAR